MLTGMDGFFFSSFSSNLLKSGMWPICIKMNHIFNVTVLILFTVLGQRLREVKIIVFNSMCAGGLSQIHPFCHRGIPLFVLQLHSFTHLARQSL